MGRRGDRGERSGTLGTKPPSPETDGHRARAGGRVTLISRMDASVSAETEVSPLPLRAEVPPSEARVAADRLGGARGP